MGRAFQPHLLDQESRWTIPASVFYAHELGLEIVTTPAYSPQSKGLTDAFLHTFKRDYVHCAELRTAGSVLAQLADWFDDYNRRAPYSALGVRPSAEYRVALELPVLSVSDFWERGAWIGGILI